MARILYCAGYNYQLETDYAVQLTIYPSHDIDIGYLSMTPKGMLTIRTGYAWDGASGPAIDTANIMRGSLVHDALYQLIREGCLPFSAREAADRELHRICLEDGMSRIRAWWTHRGVRLGGGPAAMPSAERLPRWAP